MEVFDMVGEPDYDYDDDYDDGPCWNCGGEGVVYNCLDEIGCIDPEGGCDLCERRCDVCNPRPSKKDEAAARDFQLTGGLAL